MDQARACTFDTASPFAVRRSGMAEYIYFVGKDGKMSAALKRTVGALILAGGMGRRMGGQNKALLRLEDRTFLSRIGEALSGFDEKLISVRDAAWVAGSDFEPVLDEVSGRGPLEGLRCALRACRSDALIVVPCDVPFFTAELAQALIEAGEGYDAVICKDRSGHTHPLCALYSKKCLPAIEEMAAQGNFRIMGVIDRVNSTVLDMGSANLSDDLLTNVNDPQTLESLRGN